MYLIDTHVLLWLLSDQDKLSATAKIILQEEELFLTHDSKIPLYPVATVW